MAMRNGIPCATKGIKVRKCKISEPDNVAISAASVYDNSGNGTACATILGSAVKIPSTSVHKQTSSTSSAAPTADYAAALRPASELSSQPLAGRRVAIVLETVGEGVDPGVEAAVRAAAAHMASRATAMKHQHITDETPIAMGRAQAHAAPFEPAARRPVPEPAPRRPNPPKKYIII